MTKLETGLSQKEADTNLQKFGKNTLKEEKNISFLSIAWEEIREPMILLLLVVGILYSIWGKLEDALTILVVILLLVIVEVWNEFRAKKAISSLFKAAAPKTKIIRDSRIIEIDTENIVPGDILVLSSGTRISADSKVELSYGLQVDESPLTGESFPVEKKKGDTIFAGTIVVYGEGKAEVIATGKDTKMGGIAKLTQAARPPKTPLQISMKELSKKLVWVALFFSIVIPLIGILEGHDFRQMILIGLSLAFVTIPEELPIIITMVLGLGSYKLSKQKFLAKKLKAAETLGDATVIVTDKTGTITENKMSIASVYPKNQEKDVIKSSLCAFTEFSLSPMDKSILETGKELKINEEGTIVKERNFGDGSKTRAVLRNINGIYKLFVSGAPEEIIKKSKFNNSVLEKINEETSKGRRVIAVARKVIRNYTPKLSFKEMEKNLSFVGLISFEDPPRHGVKETIEKLKHSGVKTMMVTGDHPKTAAFIAKSVGIDSKKVLTGDELDKISDEQLKDIVKNVFVYARTTPEHKYRIVKALQENGEVVAVTGDGINDTVALKQADIGIAMGIRGTDAAKEEADAVLADDNYITISNALYEGRKFFDNLKKGIKYYLSVKFALIAIFLIPIISNLPLPFSPIQIIILELFMDLAASSAFVIEPEEKDIYSRKPQKKNEPLMNSSMILGIIKSGASLFAAVMIMYFYSLYAHLSISQTQTIVFSTWIFGHIFLAFVSRSDKQSVAKLGIMTNKLILLWAFIAFAFLLIVINIPIIGTQFKVIQMPLSQWGLSFLAAFIAIFWQEAAKYKNS